MAVGRPLTDLDGARLKAGPGDRHRELVRRAEGLRERLLDAEAVPFYRSIDLFCGPYPTRYGLLNTGGMVGPYLYLSNRMFAVQFPDHEGVLRTLLWNPTFWGQEQGLLATPYFRRMGDSFGMARPLIEPLITDPAHKVPEALDKLGLRADQIDFIAYDHLHVQDLRPWLGPGGLFPSATLLITPAEWQIAVDPSPPQLDWYVAGAAAGVEPDRVHFLESDLSLGPSVHIVRTPGHTEGNQSLVVRTPEGLFVTSENGVGPDCFNPEHSRISGLKRYARDTGMDIVLNGNTLERGLDQYLSMTVERTLAGQSRRDPRFSNVVCSSELTAHWAYPGARPTFAFGEISFGKPS